jgi:hypothetical protein
MHEQRGNGGTGMLTIQPGGVVQVKKAYATQPYPQLEHGAGGGLCIGNIHTTWFLKVILAFVVVIGGIIHLNIGIRSGLGSSLGRPLAE